MNISWWLGVISVAEIIPMVGIISVAVHPTIVECGAFFNMTYLTALKRRAPRKKFYQLNWPSENIVSQRDMHPPINIHKHMKLE